MSPEYSLEGPMLKLQYFGHLIWRTNSFEMTLMLGNIEGGRRGQQRMRWLNGITDLMDMNLSELRDVVGKEGWIATIHPWNGLRHSGDSGNVDRPWSSSRLSCGEHLHLRCDGNAGNSFPTTQGKDPSSRARRRKRGSSGWGCFYRKKRKQNFQLSLLVWKN